MADHAYATRRAAPPDAARPTAGADRARLLEPFARGSEARLASAVQLLARRSEAAASRLPPALVRAARPAERTPVATSAQGAVVQRVIHVGLKTQTRQEWQAELDPDNDDEARRYALINVLTWLDGRSFATEKRFLSEVAAATAPLEAEYRKRIVAAAEQQRELQAAQQPEPELEALREEKRPFVDQREEQEEEETDPDDAPQSDESFFASRKAAFQYLAEKTSYDPEQLEAFAEFKPNSFSFLTQDIGPADIKLKFWKQELAGIEYAYDHQPEIGTGARKAKADWAIKPVRDAAKKIVAGSGDGTLFPGGAYTVHHKVSRFRLRALHTEMTKAGSGAAPVLKALQVTTPQTESPLNALLNIPGNLEVGPQERIGDPGTGFDPNFESGAMTPRSKTLGEIDTLIGAKPLDFQAVAKRLLILHQQQQDALKKRGGALITEPIKSQWTKGKGGKFERG